MTTNSLHRRIQAIAAKTSGPILALDTSTMVTSLCLAFAHEVHERTLDSPAMPSETLAQSLVDLLADGGVQPDGLGAIVVGLGPGSFTGLRVGLGTVKGLALGADIAVYGTSSLAILAASAGLCHGAGRIAVILDARREEYFAGVYDVSQHGEARCLVADGAYSLEQLTGELGSQAPRLVASEPALMDVATKFLSPNVVPIGLPRAACAMVHVEARLLAGAKEPLASLAPAYLRASEAERQLLG